jgi:hypothetical protein
MVSGAGGAELGGALDEEEAQAVVKASAASPAIEASDRNEEADSELIGNSSEMGSCCILQSSRASSISFIRSISVI